MAGMSFMTMPRRREAIDLLKTIRRRCQIQGGGARRQLLRVPARQRRKAASQDFEAVFLNSMFQQMFTGLEGEGPMGGNGATGIWRSFLTDEYAKGFAKAGGIGIADQVYSALLQQQELRS